MRDDGEDADLQFRPGERTCSWHVSSPSYDRNACDVRIVCRRRAQLAWHCLRRRSGRPCSMMNSASSAFSRRGLLERAARRRRRDRHVLGDVERVAQLVRDDDRADAFEVAQLDDLLVDRQRRDRIEAGRRLVVEQDARLGRHRPGDRDAAALPARQLRRHPVDELGEADEAEHFLDPLVDLVERQCRSPRTACSRRSRAPSASRRARLPGRPCRGRRGPPSARLRVMLSTRSPLTKIDAGVRLQQPEDQPQDRRLPGAARAEEDLRVPGLQREADVVAGSPCRRTRATRGRTRRSGRRGPSASSSSAERVRCCDRHQYISDDEQLGDEEVDRDHRDRAGDDRVGRRAADALRAARRPQADVAADARRWRSRGRTA